MGAYQLQYKPYGNAAILIEWPQEISIDILKDIRRFVAKIEDNHVKDIVELNFVYTSLLIRYNFHTINFPKLKSLLESIYNSVTIHRELMTNVWEIPVCYDTNLGIDLAYLAKEKKCRLEEIISLHSRTEYTVYGIGFLPGFLYLGGLPEILHFPRRNSPRLTVPKGAVAIGGSQTGIYPQSSPGGWHIIGNTPVSLFDIGKETPCLIEPGDKIKFEPVSKEVYDTIANAQKSGNYELKNRLNA